MTVPYVAIKMGRRGYGIELNPDYFQDGVKYLQAIEREKVAPTLFDMEEVI
jgi:DNA modification methylase